MKKIIPLLLLSLIILCPIIAESADATTVFLTSDNLHEHDADFARLNDIKERIESKTNGDIVVVWRRDTGNGSQMRCSSYNSWRLCRKFS